MPAGDGLVREEVRALAGRTERGGAHHIIACAPGRHPEPLSGLPRETRPPKIFARHGHAAEIPHVS